MNQKSVYITIPNGDGWLHKSVMFAAIKMLQDRRYRIRLDAPSHTPYVNNLAHCYNDFLNGGEDFWLSMDTDNSPTNNPLDLVDLDCDVMGLPTPVYHDAVKGDRPYYFNALKAKDDGYTPHENCNGLQEVDAVGSGCMLIARRVMLKLRYEQPFARVWAKDGTVEMGGDYSFCKKAKAAGFRIFTHFDYPCQHYNEVELLSTIQAFQAVR